MWCTQFYIPTDIDDRHHFTEKKFKVVVGVKTSVFFARKQQQQWQKNVNDIVYLSHFKGALIKVEMFS